MNKNTDPAATLTDLGLTRPEADAYLLLLTLAPAGPATGYQVAKQLGKDATSVYRALEALRQRGAVETVAGRGRMYRPVPPEELIRLLKRDFWARTVRAREQLAALAVPPDDTEIYRLATRDQALERFGQLLEECRETAFVDLAPLLLARFEPQLEAARSRGVVVKLLTRERDDAVVLRGVFDRARQLNAIFDGPPDHALSVGFWSAHALFGEQAHEGLAREIR
jgi:HTH-type transcriptional regulator, sugar sensing transcriptional regulator